jgi:hypothetical protein
MVFAMLLGSMNYNNNLSFVLTFILGGIGFVAMHQCQRNLVGLELHFAGVEPVFAGQAAQFRVAITNHSKNARHGIRLYTDDAMSEVQDLEPGESKVFVLAAMTIRIRSTRHHHHRRRRRHTDIASMTLAAKRTSPGCASFTRATRLAMWPGKPTLVPASYSPSSSPAQIRAASGSTFRQFPVMTSKNDCPS